jgi:hypothetical protein
MVDLVSPHLGSYRCNNDKRDPFITTLADGMQIAGLTVAYVEQPKDERSEVERSMRAFTASLYKQIHDASDAAYRGQYKKSQKLLKLVQTRLNHFLSKQ